jgi:hypothetical protein
MSMGKQTNRHVFFFESFNEFGGIRRFVNFQNFNSPASD